MSHPFIDAHTHKAAKTENVVRLYNLSPADWASPDPFSPFCAGIHPKGQEGSLESLEAVLKKASAVGECGLDRLAETSLEVQAELFGKHIELSERLKLPLVIHCVRAFPEMLALKRMYNPAMPWIVHGFRGNARTVRELAKHKVMLSFGAALLAPPAPLVDALEEIPKSLLLLETDEAEASIEDVYKAASALLDIELEELKHLLAENFSGAFTIPC